MPKKKARVKKSPAKKRFVRVVKKSAKTKKSKPKKLAPKKKLLKPKKPILVRVPKDKKKAAFSRKAGALLERSKKRGFVTYGEIFKEFPPI